jgi:hypothetical protein
MRISRYFIVVMVSLFSGIFPGLAQNTKPFIMPVAGPSGPSTWVLGQPYGNTTGAYITGADQYSAGQYLHFGIDIMMPCGTPLVAVATGVVDSVDNLYRGSAPHNLSLRFPDLNLSVLYGHLLERPALVEGQEVTQGQVIALSGEPEGDCDRRPHLHLEVRSLDQSTAYNPMLYIDAPWHSLMGIESRLGSPFQRDLTAPRRWMSLDDQPDVVFGGRRLNDYAQTWPPSFNRSIQANTPPDRPFTPVNQSWTLRQVGNGGCCAGAWWNPSRSDSLYFVDGVEGQLAFIHELSLDDLQLTTQQNAPPPVTSPDGTHELIYQPDKTTIRRTADGAEWYLPVSGSYPNLSPDNRLLLWTVGDEAREVWIAALDGSLSKAVWSSQGRSTTARWLDSDHVLINERELIPGRYTTLSVVNVPDGTSYSLGMWYNLRNVQIAPGGKRLIFASEFNPDPANDGAFALEIQPGAAAQKLPWFGDYRWRDAESVLYITFDPTTDIQQLNYYHIPTGDSFPLTDLTITPFTIANGDWSVSPDGNNVAFQSAQDGNLWLLSGELPTD